MTGLRQAPPMFCRNHPQRVRVHSHSILGVINSITGLEVHSKVHLEAKVPGRLVAEVPFPFLLGRYLCRYLSISG